MQENKDKEVEQLLAKLREKRQRGDMLNEIITKEEELRRRHTVEVETARAKELAEKLAAEAAEKSNQDEADSDESYDGGLFELKTADKSDGDAVNRSLRDLFRDTGDVTADKGMIPPTIERGFDRDDELEPVVLTADDRQPRRIDPSAHPLFNTPNTAEIVKPYQGGELPESAASVDSDAGLRLDEASLRRQREGVINVREKVDDEFREFFGDTVIIDRQTIDDKQSKQKKITDFVMSTKEGEIGGPIFEDEPEPEIIDEYRSEEETEPILDELTRRRNKAGFLTAVSFLCALVLVLLNLLVYYNVSVVSTLTQSAVLLFGLNAAVAFVSFLINAPQMGRGLLGLVSFNGNNDSLYALASLAAVVQPVAALLFGAEPAALIAAPVGVVAAFFASLGRYKFIKNILANFRSISTGFEKYAAFIPDDEVFSRRVSKGLEVDFPRILVKRKTGFTDNYLRYAFSLDSTSGLFKIFAPLMLVVSVICGGISFFVGRDAGQAVSTFCVCACLCSSFAATLKSTLPLEQMQNSIARFGTTVPGFEAAEEVVGANCVLLDAKEIFPKGSILLHGIKTFEKERIDKAILYAASVLIPLCDTLSPLFYNVIQGKTEILFRTDSVEYENGMGFSCWVDKSRVLIGTREMMTAHEINLPSLDYEIRYTKTRSRDAIYLAVGGELYAMFVVSYTLTTEVEEILHGFEREGISVMIRTNDFNITTKKIADIFTVPQSMYTIVRSEDANLVSGYTDYSAHSTSILNHIGSLVSFAKGIFACHKLQSSLKLTNLVTLISMVSGALVSIVLSAAGAAFSVSVVAVLAFQSAWLAIIWIISRLARY